MRRFIHNILVTVLCVCLLTTYVPGSAVAETPDPGVPTATAETTVKISTISGFSITSTTKDFAATADQIAADAEQYDLKVEITGGTAPYTYTWTRTVGTDTTEEPVQITENSQALADKFELSKHTNTLTADKTHTYKVVVKDATNAVIEGSIAVTVSNMYALKVLPKEGEFKSGVSVEGVVHYLADLSVSSIEPNSPLYGYLQENADGKNIVVAQQVDLTGTGDAAPTPPELKPGEWKASVKFEVDPTYNGKADITLVCLDSSGAIQKYPATVADGVATVADVTTLGAFALTYSEPTDPTYTVESSVDDNGGGQISPSGSRTFAKDAAPSYVLLPNTGYRIENVVVTIDGTETTHAVVGNTYTFEPLANNATIKAVFKKETPAPDTSVKVTAKVENGNGNVRIGNDGPKETVEATVKHGSSVSVDLLPNDGYVVDTVTVGGQEVSVLGSTYLISAALADTELVVKFKPGIVPPTIYHKVTATAGDNGAITPAELEVAHGQTATLTITPDENYRIKEVLVDGKDLTEQVAYNQGSLKIENIVANCQVSATFEYVKYSISASVAGSGGKISPAGATAVNSGDSLTYYLYPDAGYELKSLDLEVGEAAATSVLDAVNGGIYVLENVQADGTLVATFAPTSVVPPEDTYYTVTASVDGNGTISPDGISRVKAGESQTFYFAPGDKNKIKQVTVNGSVVVVSGFSYTLNNILKNSTIRVEYEATSDPVPEPPKSYAVTASAGKGGSISPKGTSTVYEHGSLLLEFMPDSGFELDEVTVNGAAVAVTNSSYRLYVDEYVGIAAIPVVATFKAKDVPVEPEYFLLTTEVDGGNGTVSPEGTTRIASGKDQTVSFMPAESFEIDTVMVTMGEGETVDKKTEVKNGSLQLTAITADTLVSVTYVQTATPPPPIKQHTIIAKSSAGGTISPEGSTVVNEGASLSFTLTAQNGYKLSSLLVDSKPVAIEGMSYTIENITSGHTVTAAFVRNTLPVDEYFTIHALAESGGKISPAGDVRVAAGKDMTFYFQPDTGNVVNKVMVDGKELTAAGNSYTFPSVTADASIAVSFRTATEEDPIPPTKYHTIAATSTAGGSISPAGATQVTPGGQMLYTIAADSGYTLSELSVDETPVADFTGNTYRFTAVTKDHSIEAKFVKDSTIPDPSVRYSVTAGVSAAGGGTISPEGDIEVPANGAQTFYFTPATGNKVKSIKIGTQDAIPYSSLSYTMTGISANTSIEVAFESGESPIPTPNTHKVTTAVEGNIGGTVSPLGETIVADGGSLLLTFTPQADFVLKTVKLGEKDITASVKADGSYRLTNITADAAVKATFEASGISGNEYRMLHVSAGAGGTISPSGEMRVAKGGVQSFTVTPDAAPAESPDAGKELDKITITYADGTSESAPVGAVKDGVFTFDTPLDLTKDCTVVATFNDKSGPTPPPPTMRNITATATSGGAISPAGTMSVADGSMVLYTLTPDVGYKLSSVLLNDAAVASSEFANGVYQLKATADATVHAVFTRTSENPEPGYYLVTTSVGKAASGDASGTISPAGTSRVKAGDSQTFTFIPNTDCTLDTVTVDGKAVSTENFTYTILDIAKDASIVATFKTKGSTDPEPPALATIKASATAGGSISPTGIQSFAAGTSPLFTMTPDAGYHLKTVAVGEGANTTEIAAKDLADGTYRFAPVAGNKTYTIAASFEADSSKPVDPGYYSTFASVFPVVGAANGETHGTISPVGENKVTAGGSQEFSFMPDNGYAVDKVWVKKGSSAIELTDPSFSTTSPNYTLFGVNSDMSIAVQYKEQGGAVPPATCTVKASATAGGSISPEGDTTVNVGGSVSYTFTAFEGYELYQIKLDGTTVKPVSEISNNSYRYTNTDSGAGTHSIEAMYKLKGTDPVDPDDPDKPVEKVALTASAGAGGTITPNGTFTVNKGADQPFYFYPNEGFEIDQVLVGGQPVTVTNSSYTLTDVQAPTTIAVSFKAVQNPVYSYKVTASATSGGTISPSGTIIVSHASNAPAPSVHFDLKADANYELKQLLVDGTVVSTAPDLAAYDLTSITEDTVVRAEFKAVSTGPTPTYAVVHAISGAGGTISPSGDVQVPIGSDRTFVFTPDEKHEIDTVTLDGSTDVTGSIDKSSYTIKGINKETTISVTFKETDTPVVPPTKYIITSSTTSGGTISPYGETEVVEGMDAPYLIKADSGYSLAKLEVDGNAVEGTVVNDSSVSYTITNVTKPHTIKATFEKKATPPVDPEFITVHAKAGAGGKISPEGDSRVAFGSAQTFTFVPDNGNVVDKVKVNDKEVSFSGSSYTLYSVKAETTIEVSFKSGSAPLPTYYTLSASAGGGGEISPVGDTKVLAGGSLLYSIIPEKNYVVSSVMVDGIEISGTITGSTYRFENVAANHSIAVAFDRKAEPPVQQYWDIDATVTSGNGSISPAGKTKLLDGGTQTFNFIANEGYKVAAVSIDGEEKPFSGSTYTLFNVKANSTIAVTFAAKEPTDPDPIDFFDVENTAGDNGTVSPLGTTNVAKGGALLVTIVPNEGYETDTVTVDGVVKQQGGKSYRLTNVTSDMTGDKGVKVTFKESSKPNPGPSFLHVTSKAMPVSGVTAGTVSPSGTISVPAGESKKYYVYPNSGYTIDKVLVDGKETAFIPCVMDEHSKVKSLALRTEAVLSTAYCFDVENVSKDIVAEVYFKVTSDKPVEMPTCSVVTSASTGGMIFASGSTTVPMGEPIDFAVKADEGYHLASLMKTENASAHRIALGSESSYAGGGTDVSDEVVNGIYRTAVTADMQLHATFEADSSEVVPADYVTVSAKATGGGIISPSGDTRVKYGESQPFSFIPQTGKGLVSLKVDGVDVAWSGATYTLYDLVKDTVIEATFGDVDKPEIPVTFNLSAHASAGGTLSPSGSTPVVQGSSLLYACLPDEGYVVKSVTDTANGANKDLTSTLSNNTFRISNVAEDHIISVVFEATTVDPPAPTYHIVSATSDGHGKISPSGDVRVNHGESSSFSFIPDSGYAVDRVTVNGNAVPGATNPYTIFDIKADATISVTFKQSAIPPLTAYTIDASVEGGHGTVSPAGKTSVLEGGSASFNFFPDAGYVTDRIFVDGKFVQSGGASYQFNAVKADSTLAVSFRPENEPPVKMHTITPSAGAGGKIDPSSPVDVEEGQSQTFRLIPDSGFSVSSVTVDGTGVGAVSSYTFTDIKAPHTISVTFAELQTFTISAGSSAGGTISPSGNLTVSQGDRQTFVFEPEAGYAVSAVVVDGSTIDTSQRSYTFPNIQGNHSIFVEFSKGEPLTVTASAGAGGAITPSGAVAVVKGDQQTFVFKPDTGYRVDKVMVGSAIVQVGGTSYTLMNIQDSTSISVTFAKIVAPDPDAPLVDVDVEVKVSQESSDGGLVSPSGTVSMIAHSTQKFYAFPEKGYTLDAVKVNGVPTQYYGIETTKTASLLDEPLISDEAKALLASTGGAYGGFWFEIADPKDGTKVEVAFRELGADEPQPDPIESHVVSAGSTAGGSVSPSGETKVPHGESFCLSFKAQAGYHLKSLLVNEEEVVQDMPSETLSFAESTGQRVKGAYTLSNVEADTSVYATFEADPPLKRFIISATVDDRGHGTVVPSGPTDCVQGRPAAFTFIPDTGYQVAAITVDGQTTAGHIESYEFKDVQQEHNLVVSFKPLSSGPTNPLDTFAKEIARTGDRPLFIWIGLAALIAGAVAAAIAFTRRPRSEYGHADTRSRRRKAVKKTDSRGSSDDRGPRRY